MRVIAIIFFLSSAIFVVAQTPVVNFALVDVVKESPVSLDQFTTDGVVVVFTSNVCPYDGYYNTRLRDLIIMYGSKIPFLMINSHPGPEETQEKMKAKAAGWEYSVPYLADKDQVVMGALGARRSPEVFLLKRVGQSYTTFYSGAIDDTPQDAAAVTTRYLKDAMESLLGEKNIAVPSVRTSGCSIRQK